MAGRPIFDRFSEQKKAKIRLAIVGTDTAKEVIYSRLSKGAETKAQCHFPLNYSAEYFKGLTAEEKKVTWKSGTPIVRWEKRSDAGARNEPLDCRVYALSALRSIPMALRRLRRKEAQASRVERKDDPPEVKESAAPQVPVEKPKPAKPPSQAPRRPDWRNGGGFWS